MKGVVIPFCANVLGGGLVTILTRIRVKGLVLLRLERTSSNYLELKGLLRAAEKTISA